MIQHISGETPFQVLSKKFTISSSSSGYTLQFSADGLTWADKKAVAAGTPYEANGAMGAYWRLKGNTSDIVVNWRRDACGEGGGSSANVQESKSVTLTDNGTHEITPDDGYDSLAKVEATVNVTTPATVFVVPNGCKFGRSSALPSPMDTSNVTNMSYMFSGCSTLKSIDLQGFDTSNVTSMSSMFSGCSDLKSIDLQGFDTSNVTNMGYMFSGCSDLKSIDLQGFDTSNVTSMSCMFSGCSTLKSIDLQGFDTSNVTNMSYMFSGCSTLKSIDLQGFDTSNVTNMGYMFSQTNNSAMTSMDLSGLHVEKVTDLTQMFYMMRGLVTLSLAGWRLAKASGTQQAMFSGCYNLSNFTAPEEWHINFDLTNSKSLTYGSIKSILTACANSLTTSAKTAALSVTLSDPDGELAALVTACVAKGWTITGLTLTD